MTSLATAMGASAAKPASFFKRIKRPIGLQLYTLGDEPKKDIDAVLSRVVAMGYRDAELPGLYDLAPAAIKAAADKAGLKISSIHLPGATMGPTNGLTLLSEPARIVEAMGALGVKRAVMPIAPFPPGWRPNAGETFQAAIARGFTEAGVDGWKRTAAMLNEKAAMLKPHGITLGYHNHNMEFAPVGGTTGWDIIVRETDPKLVSFEADIGWISAAGLDPVAFFKSHKNRIAQVHVKDVKATTKTNYALSMDPTEVGSGKLDWTSILQAAHKAGVQHYYVEQEPPFILSRMDAAAKSCDFLTRLA